MTPTVDVRLRTEQWPEGRLSLESGHERRGKGCHEAEEQKVDGDRHRELCARPAELLLEGQHEHAGCCTEPGSTHESEERDDGDNPGGVDATRARAFCGHWLELQRVRSSPGLR